MSAKRCLICGYSFKNYEGDAVKCPCCGTVYHKNSYSEKEGFLRISEKETQDGLSLKIRLKVKELDIIDNAIVLGQIDPEKYTTNLIDLHILISDFIEQRNLGDLRNERVEVLKSN